MIVVTGATGNVGRSLVQALAGAGEKVTATSRRVSDADLPDGVLARPADLTDAGSLRPVLDGADALFLQNGGADAHLLDPGQILDAAREGGVRRVVLLSSQGVATRPAPAVSTPTRTRGPSPSAPCGPSPRRSVTSGCPPSTRTTSPRSPRRRCGRTGTPDGSTS
jgi:uncharacterized protein YbjT (DUF2867 family)